VKRLSLILASALLAACSSGIDPIEPPSELSGFTPQLELTSIWQRTVGQGTGGHYLKLTPLLDGERLFVADRYGRVRAYDSKSGARLWQSDLERPISAGVCRRTAVVRGRRRAFRPRYAERRAALANHHE